MTFKILKSHLPATPEAFAKDVETYRHELLAHRATVNVPAPTANHLITHCVRRVTHPVADELPDSFVMDYQIIDDTPPPPPPPSLEQRKSELRAQIVKAENELFEEHLLPPGKMRLFSLKLKSALSKEERSGEDKLIIVRAEEYSAKTDKINLWAAEQMAEVDDLTDTNIDNWKIQVFKPDW